MPAPKKSSSKANGKATTTLAVGTPVAIAPAAAAPAKMNGNGKPAASNGKATAAGMTQVVAQIDVGFGNRLMIRGQGAGLSWTSSQPMQWQNGTWIWQTPSAENFEFKVMLNDKVWQQGFNLQAKAGQKIVFRPHF